jgi:Bacterial archaeo-eukaryotic release factor family 10
VEADGHDLELDPSPPPVSLPTLAQVRGLAEWQPPFGVLSVYLRFDPGDRGGAWRTELRNGLSTALARAEGIGHEARLALRETAARVEARFANHERLARGEVGFVEVVARPAAEHWWSTHLSSDSAAAVTHAERPLVAPLLGLLDSGAPRGAAMLSAERVRLLEWAPGHLEELESWEPSVFVRDWRERKAQRMPDPARAQAISASGHDQFEERLAENRHRFLTECGRLATRFAEERSWSQLLLFGAAEHARDFCRDSAPSGLAIETAGEADLISEPLARLEPPLAEAAQRLDAERHRELAERALEEAHGGTHGAAGRQEAREALEQGRVDNVVLDLARASDCEELVRQALSTGASVCMVDGDCAELLAPAEGVVALLRY